MKTRGNSRKQYGRHVSKFFARQEGLANKKVSKFRYRKALGRSAVSGGCGPGKYRQDGGVVALKPKVVETVELLVRERGRLISKHELMERLWPDTIVEESNLSQNIYLLRKVLGTDTRGRNYIETVPKRGYRFTVEVDDEIGRSSKHPSLKNSA